MSKIKVLPEFISSKIAAGEVIQRPESVVKELIENSVDAGSSTIELYIKKAGKLLIQVVDNGEGMSEDDAVMSIQKHATSKISEYEDLEAISTLGFRGEALSSVAAVAKLEIKTETRDDDLGTLIKVEENGEIIRDKGSFPKGTSIAVKNLFYNVPARRNFLKTNATELKHVIETFKRIAISKPGITFRLYNDDEIVFDYIGGDFKQRIEQVFDENIISQLINVEEITDFITVRGYVAKPSYNRKNKGDQYLFINNRYVSSKIVNHAVFSAYENILEKGEYPFYVIFLELDPGKIDVNVHPSKLEVKFENENSIYSFIKAVIKKGIGSYDLVPSMTFGNDREPGKEEKLRFDKFKPTGKGDFSDRPAAPPQRERRRPSNREAFNDYEIDLLFDSLNKEIKQNAPGREVDHPFESKKYREVQHKSSGPEHNNDEDDFAGESSFIVLLQNKYILAQIKSGLMIIDQHVAHERILYEKAVKAMSSDIPFSQQLLFSQTVQVDPGDYALLKELNPHLEKLGFQLKFFSKNSIVIEGVPGDVKLGTEIDTLTEVLNEYKKNQREKDLEIRDNLAKSYSCKAAIKAGDKITEKEMRLLVDQLFATSMPYVCPHGRPIVIKIPIEELDRRFGRT